VAAAAARGKIPVPASSPPAARGLRPPPRCPRTFAPQRAPRLLLADLSNDGRAVHGAGHAPLRPDSGPGARPPPRLGPESGRGGEGEGWEGGIPASFGGEGSQVLRGRGRAPPPGGGGGGPPFFWGGGGGGGRGGNFVTTWSFLPARRMQTWNPGAVSRLPLKRATASA
jgi:hypothetical protein